MTELYQLVMNAEDNAKNIRDFYNKLTEPEHINKIITEIVEAYANKAQHSADEGIMRNLGIEAICAELNNIQKIKTFQNNYEVIYHPKDE